MKTGTRGLALIKRFESFSPTVYFCPAGKPTVGYGHVILKGESIKPPITEAQADELLRKDAEIAENCITAYTSAPLNQNQFDALVSFVFNVGTGAYRSSTLLKKLNAEDFSGAAAEFLRWDKCKGKSLAGLTKRRQAEKELFEETV